MTDTAYVEASASAVAQYFSTAPCPFDSAAIAAAASAMADAYAAAIALAIWEYNVWVCTCCDASYASTEVAGVAQAVATAIASAYADALAEVQDCNGNPIVTASSIASVSAIGMH